MTTETVTTVVVTRNEAGAYTTYSVDYVGTRGTRKASECKFNTASAASRHGKQLMGRPMR